MAAWDRARLGDLVEMQKGFAFKSGWYSDIGRPIIKVSDFTHDSVTCSSLVRIPDEIAAHYLKYELKVGDVVVQTVGSWPSNPASVVGKCVRIPENAAGALLNQNAVKLCPSKSFEPRFLFYLLRSDNFKTFIVGTAQGAASQAAITLESIRAYEFDLPSLPVQRRISGILSAYDDLIENNTRRIRILEEMAQAIYREWFVHFRFPGHEKVKMVNSPLGKIPEGWEVKKLSALVETQYGYTESASQDEVGPKYVRGMDINKTSYIEWDSVPYCPINNTDHAKYKLASGDVLVIRMADPGKVAIIEKDVDAVFASYLIRLHIKSPLLSPYYLFYFLLSDQYQGYVTGASTGTTRKSASAGVITDINMIIPTDDIRKQFEGQVSAMRQMLNNLLEKNSNLRCTRDLLLPKLISGEVDVEGLDIDLNIKM